MLKKGGEGGRFIPVEGSVRFFVCGGEEGRRGRVGYSRSNNNKMVEKLIMETGGFVGNSFFSPRKLPVFL